MLPPGSRVWRALRRDRMQELVLIQPVSTARSELVGEAAQADARREFEERLAECGPLAFRVARGVLRNTADAEDVAQSLFLRLGRGEIPRVSNFAGYLYRAAVNGALDLLRRRKAAEPMEAAMELGAPGASPETAASDRELARILREAIGELAPRSAEMFALRYLEEMSNAEIAELMGTSQAVVAVTLYQTRLKLRKRLMDVKRGMR